MNYCDAQLKTEVPKTDHALSNNKWFLFVHNLLVVRVVHSIQGGFFFLFLIFFGKKV